MSFWIYEIAGDRARRKSPLRFTGEHGLLATFLKANAGEEPPFAWCLLPRDLIALADPSLEPDDHLIVVDLLPESFTEVSLNRVTHVQGVSDCDETDLVMAFKTLWQGTTPGPAEAARREAPFDPVGEPRNLLEAFRLTGGTERGRYQWARPKMDIGAAICSVPA
ncbi:MAG: hypothetical protein ACFB21_08925 [Opitutales bacterium]